MTYQEASLGKPYPLLWDGTPSGLSGIAAGALAPFLSSDGINWTITMQNAADFDSPPCGPVDPLDPSSQIRCEIVPEIFAGESVRVSTSGTRQWCPSLTSTAMERRTP